MSNWHLAKEYLSTADIQSVAGKAGHAGIGQGYALLAIAEAIQESKQVEAQDRQIERLQEAYSYAEKFLEAIAIGTMGRIDAITASEWIRGHVITPQDMETPK